jgi:hypothetical protein
MVSREYPKVYKVYGMSEIYVDLVYFRVHVLSVFIDAVRRTNGDRRILNSEPKARNHHSSGPTSTMDDGRVWAIISTSARQSVAYLKSPLTTSAANELVQCSDYLAIVLEWIL